MKKIIENEAKEARQVPPEKTREILDRTTRKDRRSGEVYQKQIATDKGLQQLLRQNRQPLVLFYPDDAVGTAHIVFPPSSYVSRRNYQQRITDISYAWETDKKYIFHSNQLRGPKTECSFARTTMREGIALVKRMIELYNKSGKQAEAADLQSYIDSLSVL